MTLIFLISSLLTKNNHGCRLAISGNIHVSHYTSQTETTKRKYHTKDGQIYRLGILSDFVVLGGRGDKYGIMVQLMY